MSTEDNLDSSAGPSSFSGFKDGRPLVLEIDGEAFQHNINTVTGLSSPASLMVVLKANAYGHGLLEMARVAGNHDLAVAVPEEMRQLRKAAIENRIWVLEGPFGLSCFEGSEKVVWVIHSLWQLKLFSKTKITAQFDVCLKLDTGMHRLGLDESDFSTAINYVRSSKNLNLYACMTHFSASDLPKKEYVDRQLKIFDGSLRKIDNCNILESTANSGGVLFYPQSHRDIVRPGIVLYGAMPSPALVNEYFDFKAVMRLKSAVIAVRKVSKGEGVGYGSRWVAQRDSLIATVACGYGDGYPRHAPDGTPVAVFDEASDSFVIAPLAGRVSMDMLSIDVTDIVFCKVGTKVELWGENIAVDDVARAADTIAYEVFCGITERVARKYYLSR